MLNSLSDVYLFSCIVDRCDVPLGIRDGRVTRAMFSASSMYNHLYGPWSARLQAQNRGSARGGWIAKYNNRKQFLQVDLGTTSRVKRIATQARYDANQWVKSYTVSFSNNGVRFFPYRHGKRVKVGCLRCLFFWSSEAVTTPQMMTEISQSYFKYFRSRNNYSCTMRKQNSVYYCSAISFASLTAYA